MEPGSSSSASGMQREDILSLLPVSSVVEYPKGKIIYGPDQPSTSVHLLVAGTVRLSRIADDGYEAVLEIIGAEEVFGESAFLNLARTSEQATAHENARAMVWPASTIEDLIATRPRLAVSLLQISAQRNIDFAQRIESLANDNIERRLARSLIRFSQRLGSPALGGSIRIAPMTHRLLSQHIGTSRELVTGYMNRFRRQGYLDYSRRGIVLYAKGRAAWIAGKTLPFPKKLVESSQQVRDDDN